MTRYPQGILVSCEVPWDDKYRLLDDVFRAELRMVLKHFNHLYIFGTAGEGYAVDAPRFRDIVRIFREETNRPDVHPMVGVIGLSTNLVIEQLAIAHAAGFRVFQISLPAWGALNDRELMTFFKDVCGAFPDSKFLHYNLGRVKRVLEGPDYRKLVDVIPNLVATKNTMGGLARAAGLLTHAPELQHFLGEENFPHGCMYGECSILASFGPMSPHKIKALFDAGLRRDLPTLFALQKECHDMKMAVLGALFREDRIDGAYDKLLKRLGGLETMPLRLLSPYEGFTEEQYQNCKRILHSRFPEWVANAT